MLTTLVNHMRRYVELNDEEVKTISTLVKQRFLKRKEYLLKEGQTCHEIFFIEEGCARLYFVNKKGTEQITQFAIENWWIADFMSFETQKPSEFFIQAIEPLTVCSVERSAQEKLMKQVPQTERYFRLMLQRAYAAAQLRFKYLHDFSKEESYEHFITSFPQFIQRVPQYMLASYLGFTPEYLSELRKKAR